jgi:hypothetical protein
MTDPLGVPWRQGRHNPQLVYARTGGDDWEADPLVLVAMHPDLAAVAIRHHNQWLEQWG